MGVSEAKGFSPTSAYCFDPRDLKKAFYGDLGARAILHEAQSGRNVAYVDTDYNAHYLNEKEPL